jgi:hypothetical protein
LDTKVSDFRELTFGNEYSDDVIDLKLLNLKAGTLLAAVELINEDVKKRALKSEIPTDYITIADVEAKGYLTSYTETDPTVPAWAKEAEKPSYDISEINDSTNNTSLLAIIENLQS